MDPESMRKHAAAKAVCKTAEERYAAETLERRAMMFYLLAERVKELQQSPSTTPKPTPTLVPTPIQGTIVNQLAQVIVDQQQAQLKAQQPIQAPVPVPRDAPDPTSTCAKVNNCMTILQCVLCLVFCIFPTD